MWQNTAGKKIVMALTGAGMLGFIAFHLIGNSTIYLGRLNAYTARLDSLALILWVVRLVLAALLVAHVLFGIRLHLENRAAMSSGYAGRKYLGSTLAGRNMIWTGALVGAFIIYHLLHFTFQVTNPAISSKMNADVLGRPDVAKMVVLSFERPAIAAVYIAALAALALHVSHGVQSLFQSLGLNNDRWLPAFIKTGVIAAIIAFFGYSAIPVTILARILK